MYIRTCPKQYRIKFVDDSWEKIRLKVIFGKSSKSKTLIVNCVSKMTAEQGGEKEQKAGKIPRPCQRPEKVEEYESEGNTN